MQPAALQALSPDLGALLARPVGLQSWFCSDRVRRVGHPMTIANQRIRRRMIAMSSYGGAGVSTGYGLWKSLERQIT